MDDPPAAVAETDAPTDRPTETLDVRDLPPPKPLSETLERVAELDDDVVLVQLNDRAPQHLYPKLTDRGYAFETVETDDCVVTVVWRE
jgi:TusA-related sulfurtransferase